MVVKRGEARRVDIYPAQALPAPFLAQGQQQIIAVPLEARLRLAASKEEEMVGAGFGHGQFTASRY